MDYAMEFYFELRKNISDENWNEIMAYRSHFLAMQEKGEITVPTDIKLLGCPVKITLVCDFTENESQLNSKT